MNTSWLLSLETIKSNFKACTLPLNYQRYRLMQIIASLRQLCTEPNLGLGNFWKKLSFRERLLFEIPWRILSYFPLRFRRFYVNWLTKSFGSHPHNPGKHIEQRFANIQEFFETIDPFSFS